MERRVIVGYARTSTLEYNRALQRDAVERAGYERIYEDHVSGARTERPAWAPASDDLREGGTLVVWRLDGLGRSLKLLIDNDQRARRPRCGLQKPDREHRHHHPGGRLAFHVFGAPAKFERELIRERAGSGLAAARARGPKTGGDGS